MARNRVRLADEVVDLEAKGKKHFDALHAAQEGQRKAEADLANIERCINRDQEDFQKERDEWARAKAELIKARENAELAKLAAEKETAEALNKVAELNAKLSEVEARPSSEEEWFAIWKESKACETFVNQVGSTTHKMGMDDAHKRMKAAFAKSHPSFSWAEAMASYKALLEEEDRAILAELNIALSDEDEDVAEEVAGEDQQPGVARSEEPTRSTNEQTDPQLLRPCFLFILH